MRNIIHSHMNSIYDANLRLIIDIPKSLLTRALLCINIHCVLVRPVKYPMFSRPRYTSQPNGPDSIRIALVCCQALLAEEAE